MGFMWMLLGTLARLVSVHGNLWWWKQKKVSLNSVFYTDMCLTTQTRHIFSTKKIRYEYIYYSNTFVYRLNCPCWLFRERWVYWKTDIPPCGDFYGCATPGSGWMRETCNPNCFNGGTFSSYPYDGWYGGYCSCPIGTRGSCCEQSMFTY